MLSYVTKMVKISYILMETVYKYCYICMLFVKCTNVLRFFFFNRSSTKFTNVLRSFFLFNRTRAK